MISRKTRKNHFCLVKNTRIAEFFFQPERLNVAITHPRSKLIIIGSRFVLNAEPIDPDLQETVSLLESLMESCAYVSVTQDSSPEIWESEW